MEAIGGAISMLNWPNICLRGPQWPQAQQVGQSQLFSGRQIANCNKSDPSPTRFLPLPVHIFHTLDTNLSPGTPKQQSICYFTEISFFFLVHSGRILQRQCQQRTSPLMTPRYPVIFGESTIQGCNCASKIPSPIRLLQPNIYHKKIWCQGRIHQARLHWPLHQVYSRGNVSPCGISSILLRHQ